MTESFSHLHVHTEFSMLDGAARLDELVAKAVADGQPAIGITDHGNMYGTLEFYKECRRQGIKPIIGTEAYMAHDHRSERPARRGRLDDSGGDTEGGRKLYYHLTLLAENETGYRNLIQLSSLAFLEGYYYKPRMDWELLEKYHDGLIATTGCLGGHVLQALLQGDDKGAFEKAGRLQEIFGKDNLFVELQDHGLPAQRETNPKLLDIARRIGAPLLATNDSHYTHREDHEAHDALLCVQTGATLSDPKRFKIEGQEHYLKTADEMRYLFREVPEACDNTLWIAERAELDITFGEALLPNFDVPEGFTSDREYLEHLTWAGARERWGDELPGSVVDRIAYELKVINDMGFASYFLITWDLVKHARDLAIRVGPGRGSAAGSAVSYCLRITDLDPIKYDLLFERFLNPSRISMPDIDMDFDSRYRDEMIRYAAERYGRDHVAQIITFGTIKARNAVRDAARVLGYSYAVGDKIAKAMPPLVMGRDTPLKYCFEKVDKYADGYKAASELRAMYDTDTDVKKVVDVAKGLEGLKRSDGIHAAAVVITKEPLTTYLPIQRKPESGQNPDDAPIVTQYEMGGVEALGLLKIDFLGLRNLDVITDTVEMIRAGRDPDFDIDTISLDDADDVRAAVAGRHDRRVPARVAADAAVAEGDGTDDVRPRGCVDRAVPAGADGRQHALRLRRSQERPQAGGPVPRRRRRPAGRHVRVDDLPGKHDAGRPEVRRLLARRSRQPAQGVRQEGPRDDGPRARLVRGGLRTHRLRTPTRQDAVRHHRAVRRLRLQQEPQLRVRADHLPDGVPEGALPGRVLRVHVEQREEQPRPRRGVPVGCPGDGHPRAHPRHQPVGHRLRGAAPRRRPGERQPARSAARARSRSGSPRCATSARDWSSSCSSSAPRTGRTPTSTSSPSVRRKECSTSGRSSH